MKKQALWIGKNISDTKKVAIDLHKMTLENNMFYSFLGMYVCYSEWLRITRFKLKPGEQKKVIFSVKKTK